MANIVVCEHCRGSFPFAPFLVDSPGTIRCCMCRQTFRHHLAVSGPASVLGAGQDTRPDPQPASQKKKVIFHCSPKWECCQDLCRQLNATWVDKVAPVDGDAVVIVVVPIVSRVDEHTIVALLKQYRSFTSSVVLLKVSLGRESFGDSSLDHLWLPHSYVPPSSPIVLAGMCARTMNGVEWRDAGFVPELKRML